MATCIRGKRHNFNALTNDGSTCCKKCKKERVKPKRLEINRRYRRKHGVN